MVHTLFIYTAVYFCLESFPFTVQPHLEEEESIQPVGLLNWWSSPNASPYTPSQSPSRSLLRFKRSGACFFGEEKFDLIIFKSISHRLRKKFVAKLNNTTNTAHHRVDLAEPVPTPLRSSTFIKIRPSYPHSRILSSPSWSFQVFVNKGVSVRPQRRLWSPSLTRHQVARSTSSAPQESTSPSLPGHHCVTVSVTENFRKFLNFG